MSEGQIKLNKFFIHQYGWLHNYCTLLNKNNADEILHETFIKLSKRMKKPFTGNITGYTIISLNNTMKSLLKNNNINDIEQHQKELEHFLQDRDVDNVDRINYLENIQYLSKNIFNYLEKYYSEKDVYIFKIYFLNKKMTYKKVRTITDYSESTISNTIKVIKKDLKKNLIKYIDEENN